MENSPITMELYSIDWAVRFDEFRKFSQTSYSDLHQLLDKLANLTKSKLDGSDGDFDDIKVLKNKHAAAKVDSSEWHRLSILIHLKIIDASMPKGLTATETLSAIQMMEHLWKALSMEQQIRQNAPIQSKPAAKPAVAPSPAKATKQEQPAAYTGQKKPAPVKPVNNTQAKPATPANVRDNRNASNQTENVVINKLAEEAGIDDKSMATRCYAVASSLAEEYPECTLTAIRVMTAEKLGVTRQFVENLDIKPARFKNAQ